MTSNSDEVARAAGFIDARGRREFIRFGIAGLLASLLNAHMALLSIVFARAGHSLHTIGLLLSLFAVPVLVMTVVAGPVSSRLGALWTARLAIVLMILGFGSLALTSDSFGLALLSRLVHGLGFGLYLPALMTYGQSRLNQVRFLGLVITFSSLIPFSYALGPAMGEFVLERYGVTTFFLAALAPALAGLALTIGLRPLRKPKSQGLDFSAALRRTFALPLCALFAGGLLHGYSLAFLPPDLQLRGVALAIFFIPSTIATALSRVGGSVLHRLHPRVLVAGGLSLMGFGLVLLAVAGALIPVVIVGAVAFGLGSSVLYPVVSAWISQGLDPARRAGPQAVITAIFYAGLYGMPFPLSFVVASGGYRMTEILLAAIGLLLAALVAASHVMRAAR
ncbi:MAG: Major facilitator superfamily 1 [Hyphomicrobiales bacterium]|nr:Major facilitator superfamily 1 [Hyphomicrobiales bacterium]